MSKIMVKNVSEIKGFEEFYNYEIHADGTLQNIKTGKYIKACPSCTGYVKYILNNKETHVNVDVHRLVALAFVPGYKDGLQVDHIDRNKKNNHYTNLRWVTPKENCSNRTLNKNKKNYYIIAEDLNTKNPQLFKSVLECSRKLNIYKSNIYKCVYGDRKTTQGYKIYSIER